MWKKRAKSNKIGVDGGGFDEKGCHIQIFCLLCTGFSFSISLGKVRISSKLVATLNDERSKEKNMDVMTERRRNGRREGKTSRWG